MRVGSLTWPVGVEALTDPGGAGSLQLPWVCRKAGDAVRGGDSGHTWAWPAPLTDFGISALGPCLGSPRGEECGACGPL